MMATLHLISFAETRFTETHSSPRPYLSFVKLLRFGDLLFGKY